VCMGIGRLGRERRGERIGVVEMGMWNWRWGRGSRGDVRWGRMEDRLVGLSCRSLESL